MLGQPIVLPPNARINIREYHADWHRRQDLIFIDLTGATTKMTRLRGRSVKSYRLNTKAPFGHRGKQSLEVILFQDTLKDIYFAEKRIVKALPKMVKGPQNGLLQSIS